MTDELGQRLRAAWASGSADALVDVGCDLADEGRQEEAEECFRRAIALGEDWVWFNVGNTVRELGRPEEAVEAYRRALAAGETDAWLNLGAVLEDLGDLDGAVDAYTRAGEEARDPEGFLRLAELRREQGRPEAAEAAADRAAAAGHLPAVGLLASWRWQRTGDVALEPLLRQGAAVCGAARADLAQLLLRTGRRPQARAELERGAKLGQRECWLPLGNLFAGDDLLAGGERDDPASGDVDLAAAEDAYRAGIAAGDTHCHHNLGVLLLQRGEAAGAEEEFRAGAVAGDALAERALRRLRGPEAG
ncbi:tetratricopeptide repeat protein [Kineococcus siccus]|uniref:tetratricopeptide repeat protein n=1 Tax=Kineococcus siccus TaxID=2696567 RepID=UPI00196A2348